MINPTARIARNLLVATALIIGLPCALVQSHNPPSPAPDFAASAQQEPFRRVAEDFIAAAA